MSQTIVFLSGFAVPNWLSKTKLIWDDSLWKDYKRIYVPSKTPLSDNMVDRELDNLCQLVNSLDNPTVVGQSLGGWWAANLACHPQSKINKLVLWTPVCHAGVYPVFNVTERHNPAWKKPNTNNYGPHRTLISYANDDWLAPYEYHALSLRSKFNATTYRLEGGHWFQSNHHLGLLFMKDWIELE